MTTKHSWWLAATTVAALVAPALAAGTGGIEGTVIDQATGKPLTTAVDVTADCGGVRKTARSDSSGHFTFDKLPEGTCTLTIGGGQYESTRIAVAVAGGSIAPLMASVMTKAYAAEMRRAQAAYEQQLKHARRDRRPAGVDRAEAEPMPAPAAAPPPMAPSPDQPQRRLEAKKDVAKLEVGAGGKAGRAGGGGAPRVMGARPGAEKAKGLVDLKEMPAREFGRRAQAQQLQQAGNQGWALVRVFPTVEHPKSNDGVRDDFRETVYWNPTVETNGNGEAEVSFGLSDSTTSFRATAEGFTTAGLAGGGQATFDARLPLTLDARLPVEVTAGDVIKLPVTLANETAEPIEANLAAKFGSAFKVVGPTIGSAIRIAPKQKQTMFFALEVVATSGTGEVSLKMAGGGLTDEIKKTIRVVPKGFPMEASASGTASRGEPSRHTIDLAGALPGSIQAKVTMFPSPVAQMATGMEGMIREPGGCFEQASSTNYPNIMILGYMKATSGADPALIAKTNGVLANGYKLLTGYETPEKGYEWFGSSPGHEALTAYGLMEFADMSKVFNVDRTMVERTAAWLMSRRDNKGGFLRNERALDSFGRATPTTTNAYIMWALAEAKRTDGLTNELAVQKKLGNETADPYLLALATNTNLLAAPTAAESAAMVKRLAGLQAKDGSFAGAKESITMSGGESLTIETTSLGVLAMIKGSPKHEYDAQIRAGAEWINSKRGGWGSWGNTQATILGLKALEAYAQHARQTEAGGAATLIVNGKEAGTIRFAKGRRDPLVWSDFAGKLAPGKNTIELRLDSAASLPYSVAFEYRSAQPASSPRTKVALATQLLKSSAKMGEGLTLRAHVENKTAGGLPMTLARIGLPGGTVFQTWQLKELREKGLIDFYETRPREVILYWRALAPNAKKDVDINLLANIPGTYEAPASSAYLYYTAEDKAWTKAVAAAIE